MIWWIFGSLATLVLVGYVAYKYPTLFGKAVNEGATIVNQAGDAIQKANSNTAGQ